MVKIQLSLYEESTPHGQIKEFSRTNKNDQGRIINIIGQSLNNSPYKVLETVRNVDGKIYQHKYELGHSDVEKLFKDHENKPVKTITEKAPAKKVAKKPAKKVAKKPTKKVAKKPTKKEEEKGFLSKIFGL